MLYKSFFAPVFYLPAVHKKCCTKALVNYPAFNRYTQVDLSPFDRRIGAAGDRGNCWILTGANLLKT